VNLNFSLLFIKTGKKILIIKEVREKERERELIKVAQGKEKKRK
jgi:hypothetical protein